MTDRLFDDDPQTAQDDHAVARAKAKALKLIEKRPLTRAQLRERLVRDGFEERVRDAAIAQLESVGLLDDASLAADVVQRELESGAGERRLDERLRKLGIADTDRERAIHDALDGRDQLLDAIDAANRRASKMGDLPPETKLRRLFAYLVRRGFDEETCREAATRVVRRDQPID